MSDKLAIEWEGQSMPGFWRVGQRMKTAGRMRRFFFALKKTLT